MWCRIRNESQGVVDTTAICELETQILLFQLADHTCVAVRTISPL